MIFNSLGRLFTAQRRFANDGPTPMVWTGDKSQSTLVNPESGKLYASGTTVTASTFQESSFHRGTPSIWSGAELTWCPCCPSRAAPLKLVGRDRWSLPRN